MESTKKSILLVADLERGSLGESEEKLLCKNLNMSLVGEAGQIQTILQLPKNVQRTQSGGLGRSIPSEEAGPETQKEVNSALEGHLPPVYPDPPPEGSGSGSALADIPFSAEFTRLSATVDVLRWKRGNAHQLKLLVWVNLEKP